MELLQQRAIVLRTTPLKEADLIVSLLGEQTGRISALARSARRSKKRFMGGIDAFDCGRFQLSTPKSNSSLYSLNSIEARQSWSELRKNLDALCLGGLCLELTETLTAEGDETGGALFALLFHSLKALAFQNDRSSRLSVSAYYMLEVFPN